MVKIGPFYKAIFSICGQLRTLEPKGNGGEGTPPRHCTHALIYLNTNPSKGLPAASVHLRRVMLAKTGNGTVDRA